MLIVGTAGLAYARHTKTPALQDQSQQERIVPYGAVQEDAIWERGHRRINVCWENPENTTQQDRTIVEQAITETWQAHSALRFVWAPQACAQQTVGLRIFVEDSSDLGPHTNCKNHDGSKCLGKFLDRLEHGIVLNFTYQNWSPSCQSAVAYCDRAIAVHEFGHALGFAHEQNRPDTPGECQKEKLVQGPGGLGGKFKLLLLTKWDPNSVMNYCNAKWNNDGNLSEGDIRSLAYEYSTP